MDMLWIFAAVLVVLIVAANFLGKKEKPSGNCKNCPEYRYCGGGRPRCARRNETAR